jgi:hypothetical protein
MYTSRVLLNEKIAQDGARQEQFRGKLVDAQQVVCSHAGEEEVKPLTLGHCEKRFHRRHCGNE